VPAVFATTPGRHGRPCLHHPCLSHPSPPGRLEGRATTLIHRSARRFFPFPDFKPVSPLVVAQRRVPGPGEETHSPFPPQPQMFSARTLASMYEKASASRFSSSQVAAAPSHRQRGTCDNIKTPPLPPMQRSPDGPQICTPGFQYQVKSARPEPEPEIALPSLPAEQPCQPAATCDHPAFITPQEAR
jgi:hypothetical protein